MSTGPQPSTAATRRTRPRDRKLSILRAAETAFAKNGYHRTSMADIARSLDITSTALYRHFKNKEDLLAQTLIGGLDTTLERLQRARRTDENGVAILDELVAMSLEFRGLPRLWQREVRNLSPDVRRGVLMRVLRLNVQLRHAVAMRRPDLAAEDVELLAWCVLSIAVSPSHHNVQLPTEQFATQLGAMIDAVVESDAVFGGDARRPYPRTSALTDNTDTTDDALERAIRPERLLVAAARLFNTRGYAAVGIEDIGAAAGIAGPSIYHHFESKADLLTEIVERSEQWIVLYTSRALMVGTTTEQSLSLILKSYTQFALEQPDMIGTAVTEVIHLPETHGARFRKAHRDGVVRWARLLQVARPELELDAARVQIQAMTTIVNDAVRNDRIRTRPDLVDAICAIGERVMFATAAPEHLAGPNIAGQSALSP